MTKKQTLILGIESSCDETAAAVVRNGHEILSNVVASQIDSHKRFGGVVPEIASRHHVEQITIVIEEALTQADVSLAEIDGIAVTEGPGLVGALLIGVNAAKTLAFSHQIPLIGVHHIAGHIYANRFETAMKFPLLALVVSGGHTELVLMRAHNDFEIIGETRDDAAGEAYDKVARALGLSYPGGVEIDKLAQTGEDTFHFPRAMLNEDNFDFSFSGLKSAFINTLHNMRQKDLEPSPADMAASFQESVVDVLVNKTLRAAKKYQVKQLLLAGGVAANKGLRARLIQEAEVEISDVSLVIPPLSLCGDNAAMIAAAGTIAYQKCQFGNLAMNAEPGLTFNEVQND
ncbi:tRNA (adenosine(37)-N6)-threonylcarbamoyltransferase complex transferase subunit TsaD [Listeria sp. PSOL-1]|uniref:tRNA (adenosine(37)-N6)-threonylcarbamoyltransferase complex transferase subunit TsaD n=1 Tax=Listeria sp. PSOL-1 TaxID=1844999 RepID=UPI0013D5EAC0|nr:tRNA (adenosine(37)-N6)-threonylcarbamoyltransferase complex transferase subunit TsaD [Listeria sp. PSOL-1]